MKIIVSMFFSLLCFAGFGQVFQTNNSPVKFRGLKADTMLVAPAGNDTSFMANPKWGQPMDGALFVRKSDSTLWVKVGQSWHLVGGNGQLSGDTTVYDFVLDSTGQEGFRVLFAVNNKIMGSPRFWYDSVNTILRISSSKGLGSNYDLAVGGNSYFGNDIRLNQAPGVSDTNNYKILVRDQIGGMVRQFDYWPSGSGVSTSRTININGVVQDLSSDRQWRAGLSNTGALTYAGASVASATTINVGAVTGIVSNNETTPGTPNYTLVNFAGLSNISVPTIGSGLATYLLINASGGLVFQNTYPTTAERKANIYLSKISHPNLTSISFVINEVDFVTSPLQQFRDLFQAFNYVNDGVQASGNAGLTINTTAGTILGNGINFVADRTKPNNADLVAGAPRNFVLLNQSGPGSGSFQTAIDPTTYDNAGTTTVIGGGTNRSTIQYLFYVPGVGFAIQRGQTIYSTLADAISAVGRESFTIRANFIKNSIVIAAIAMRHTTTNMNDLDFARIIPADKLGQLLGGSSGIAVSTLQSAYNNSVIPQIVTDATRDGVTIRRGSAADTDTTFKIQNGAGGTTFAILGNGRVWPDSIAIKRVNGHYIGYNSGFGSTGTSGGNTQGSTGVSASASDSTNIYIGKFSGSATLGGQSNVGIGFGTLASLTTGIGNVAVNDKAGRSITSGFDNISIGRESLEANQTGSWNIAIGNRALEAYTGSENVAIGSNALGTVSSAGHNQNVAIGFSSLVDAVSALNTAVGRGSLNSLTTGERSTGVGANSGGNITTGTQNTFVGYLSGNGTGLIANKSNNVAVGVESGYYHSGSNNVFLGLSAGRGRPTSVSYHNTGDRNIAIGVSAAAGGGSVQQTGSDNITIGYNTNPFAPTGSNQLTIGTGTADWITRSSAGNYRINPTGTAGGAFDASAALEITGTTMGLLIPRLTTAQRNTISSPATGLLVYDTDSTRVMQYTGSAWKGYKFTDEGGAGGLTGSDVILNQRAKQSGKVYNIMTGMLDSLHASTSTGLIVVANNSGAEIGRLGPGGGITASWEGLHTFNGGATINGTTTIGSLTGMLRGTSGVVSAVDTGRCPTCIATGGALTKVADSLAESMHVPIFTVSKYNALGSGLKAVTAPIELISTSNVLVASGTLNANSFYITKNTTVSKVWFFQVIQGNYTASNYNGIGIYSYASGTSTLVASTTNDGDIWKATANSWVQKDLSSPVMLTPGVYYLVGLYSSSAQVAAPTIGHLPNAVSTSIFNSAIHANFAKIRWVLAGQTSLPASIAMSTTTTNQFVPWFGVE